MKNFFTFLFFLALFIGAVILSFVNHDPESTGLPQKISPVFATSPVPGDADDCAIWVHPKDPSLSVIIGNDKTNSGALYLWDMQGHLLSKSKTIKQPSNVDIRQNVPVGEELWDIVACAVQDSNEILVFRMDPQTRSLQNVTTEKKIFSEFPRDTYGFSLYLRSYDKALFAFVSQKKTNDIHELRLWPDKEGTIQGELVRSFGKKKMHGFIEGMVVDDELDYLYAADEREGILKFWANPDRNDNTLLHKFARSDGIKGEREGLALYKKNRDEGYLLLSSQEDHSLKVYDRKENNRYLKTIYKVGSKKTDGIAASSADLGAKLPKGALVCHNEHDDNFAVYNWEEIEREIKR